MGYEAEIRQPLDRGDWEQREVYDLLLPRRTTSADEIAETDVDDLFVELFGNTLGRNKLRNELVHHWLRTRAMLQGTSENRLAMIDELRGATTKLQDADRALGERT